MFSLKVLKERFTGARTDTETFGSFESKKADNINNKSPSHDRYYTKISAYLFYLLSFIVCYQAAAFFWYKIPYTSPALAGLTAQELKKIRSPGKYIRLSSYTIFGTEPQITAVASSGKPGPRRAKLDIKITGISASSDPDKGVVAFIYKGTEDVYTVGDKIPGTDAVITRIKPSEIIINNGGVEEVVVLPEERYASGIVADTKVQSGNSSKNLDPEQLKTVRTELLSNPGNLFNYINIKPSQKDGKIVGYELNPGSEGKLFIDAGLKAGDIAVEINGRDLTDNEQAMGVMGELQNMTQINIVVDRNGSRETIVLDIQ